MEPLEVLKKYWRFGSFRPLQEDIIRSVLSGRETLALLPTGGGKSVCFQIPALCLNGICIVVVPLIALMKDQVEQLKKKGIKATAIYSGMSTREIDITLDNCIYGTFKFLYVSPERLKSELFLARARQMNISLLAVDEAHCISQWGYDFRPPYLEIATFKDQVKVEKIIAVTASATREVKEDILQKLTMKKAEVFKQSFARKNLSYSVFLLEDKEQKLLNILSSVPGSAIIYVRNRKSTKVYADFLNRNGITSDFYHAGLSGPDRAKKQDAWTNNLIRVIVATNAFGMGIDKPEVRVVIHVDLPDTLEAYYQEAGRAGRDQRNAFAVALYSPLDRQKLKERVQKSFVPMAVLDTTYQRLCNFYKLAIGSQPTNQLPFNFSLFCNNYNLDPTITFQALKKLDREGIIQINESFLERSRLIILWEKTELYKYQISHPKFDTIIKVILRLYGGEVFNNYVLIKEKEISQLARRSPADTKKQLIHLHEQEVIDYHFPKEGQTVTFPIPRVASGKLPVDEKLMKKREALALAKLVQLEAYLDTEGCRSLFLQSYFDDDSEIPCGVCDNDIAKKKIYDLVPERELLACLEEAKNINQLRRELPKYAKFAIYESLRTLIEDGQVLASGGCFEKSSK